MSSGDGRAPEELELGVSDPSQLEALRDWLRAVPGVRARSVPGEVGPGELGALDALAVAAVTSALVAAVKVLPEFIRSRRVGFRIEATVRGQRLTLEASNVDELMPVLEKLLDGGE